MKTKIIYKVEKRNGKYFGQIDLNSGRSPNYSNFRDLYIGKGSVTKENISYTDKVGDSFDTYEEAKDLCKKYNDQILQVEKDKISQAEDENNAEFTFD